MENPENISPVETENPDLKSQVESLRQLVSSLLVLMIIVTGTFCLFLLHQSKNARRDVNLIKPQVAQMVNEYNTTMAPGLSNFVGSLIQFSQTNPDFVPILAKYGLTNAPAQTTPPTQKTLPVGGASSPIPPK
jgi:hypothetical protein